MKTLAALIALYQPGVGDTIYVDTGSHRLYRNVIIGSASAGLTISGPGAQPATLNRGNTNLGAYVIDLDADNLTFNRLSVTGGEYGIHGGSSLGLVITNSTFYDNKTAG